MTSFTASGSEGHEILKSFVTPHKTLTQVLIPTVPQPFQLKLQPGSKSTCTSASYADASGSAPGSCNVGCKNGQTCAGGSKCSCNALDILSIIQVATYAGTCGDNKQGTQWTFKATSDDDGKQPISLTYCFFGNTPVYLVEQFGNPGDSLLADAVTPSVHNATLGDPSAGQGQLLIIFMSYDVAPVPASTFDMPSECSCSR